jgi:hypothetical protein
MLWVGVGGCGMGRRGEGVRLATYFLMFSLAKTQMAEPFLVALSTPTR